MKHFELLEHTADVKVRVYGATLEELFTHALQSLFFYMKPIPITESCDAQDHEECESIRVIEIESPDLGALLVDYLSEALYLADRYNEAYYDVEIETLDTYYIKASLFGFAIKRFEGVEIKAITYHDLKIEQRDDIWIAEIVFDI